MQAVVPAAGRGTRLRPLTDNRPKGLVDVGGESLLHHCFARLADVGVSEIIVVVGYRGQAIIDHFGDHFKDIPLTYAWQDEPKGLAHAVLAAREHIAGPFIEVHGDYVFGQSLAPLVERFRNIDVAVTALTSEVSREAATKLGVCVFDETGKLIELREKPDDPPSTTAITGAFVFEPVIFPACEVITPSARDEFEITDAIDLLLDAGHDIDLVPADDWLINVNTPADRERAAHWLRTRS